MRRGAGRISNLTGLISVRFLFVPILLLFAVSEVDAQLKGRPTPARQTPAVWDKDESLRMWEAFREMQHAGMFGFQFELDERPYRGDSFIRHGRIFGRWFGEDRWTRIEMECADGGTQVWIIHSGRFARVWRKNEDAFVEISENGLSQPLDPDVSIQLFDLTMPYLWWEFVGNRGSGRIMGRPVQRLVLENIDPKADFVEAELSMDQAFLVPLQVSIADNEGAEVRRWQVAQLKRHHEDWLVSRIDVSDRPNRSRTRLSITHVFSGEVLPQSLWNPAFGGMCDFFDAAWDRL